MKTCDKRPNGPTHQGKGMTQFCKENLELFFFRAYYGVGPQLGEIGK